MDGNGHKPTAEDVRSAFEDAGDWYQAREPFAEPVAASEQAVLGAMLGSAAAVAEAAAILGSEHFASPAHQLVFEAVMRLADAGDPVDPASVLAELFRAGTLTKVGAPKMGTAGPFLHSLIERAGSVSYHAPRVLAAWQRRNIALVLRQCMQVTEAADWDPDAHLDEIRKRIEDATALAGTAGLHPNSETVTEVLDALEHKTDPGLSTGWRDLDEAIGGLRPKELLVLAGRPGQGKTLGGLNIADHVGTHLGLPVLFASLEMTEAELTQRRISAAAKVPLHRIVRHDVGDDGWEKISRAMDRLMNTGLHIDETSRQSPAHIRARLRAMARTGKAARLLVIDYLGYMAEPKAESRQQAVAELARQCKNIAREFAIPVILLAQLNRGPETRSDKRPVPADLRESGEIEQSADIIILLHREDAYEPESPRAGEIDFLVSKNRQGAQCTVTLAFQGHYARIKGMARDDMDPDEWTPYSALGGAQ
jgi:replicative DNA helicase